MYTYHYQFSLPTFLRLTECRVSVGSLSRFLGWTLTWSWNSVGACFGPFHELIQRRLLPHVVSEEAQASMKIYPATQTSIPEPTRQIQRLDYLSIG